MLFNSYAFIFVFLPISLVGFYLLRTKHWHLRSQMIWLIVCSLVFYAWWNPAYLLLLLVSVIFNYAASLYISRTKSRIALGLCIAANIMTLAYYKYGHFLAYNFRMIGVPIALEKVVLPLAISFYTFQQIAYLVDSYREPQNNSGFLEYCIFVTFFPQLIAGPIVHHAEMMPQFRKNNPFRNTDLSVGLTIFTIGLAKKVIFADRVAVYASPLFDAVGNGANPTFLDSWLGGLAYALQLYYDFSGYSDMAVGVARCFGVILPVNFNSPYKAVDISDFWRRWHITLSRFLRDYVYIPLGGNRKGQTRKLANLLSTMLLGGLWHGAGWTFVAWGGMHGIYLVFHELWRKIIRIPTSIGTIMFGWLATMAAVIISWIPFRCNSISSSLLIMKSMLGFNGISLPESMSNLPLGIPSMVDRFGFSFSGAYNIPVEGSELGRLATIFILAAITIIAPNTQQIMINHKPALATYEGDISKPGLLGFTWEPTRAMAFIFGASLFVSVSQIGKISPFLYFNF